MHPIDIAAALKKSDSSQAQIAREMKITPSGVHLTINGRSRSRRIERRISRITGIPLQDLWPQWYAKGGKSYAHVA